MSLLILSLLVMSAAARAQTYSPITISSPHAQQGGEFGSSVAITGSTVVVGAPYETSSSEEFAGNAYLFNSTGHYLSELSNSFPGYYGNLGGAVAADGDIVVIGAPGEASDGLPSAGNAFDDNLQAQDSLVLSSPSPQSGGGFGTSIAVAGNLIVIGAPFEASGGVAEAGNVYVFDAQTGGLLSTLTSGNPQGDGNFGYSVAISGDTVVVGAPGESVGDLAGAGRAYVFDASSGGLTATLTSENPQSAGHFGWSVAVDGDTAVVGAPLETSVLGQVGEGGNAYTFNAGTGSITGFVANPDPVAWGEFGFSVAVSGNTVIVGAPYASAGSAYVFDFNTGDNDTLTSPNSQAGGSFGYSVGIDGGSIVVGADQETSGEYASAGNAYIFLLTSVSSTTATIYSTTTSPTTVTTTETSTATTVSTSTLTSQTTTTTTATTVSPPTTVTTVVPSTTTETTTQLVPTTQSVTTTVATTATTTVVSVSTQPQATVTVTAAPTSTVTTTQPASTSTVVSTASSNYTTTLSLVTTQLTVVQVTTTLSPSTVTESSNVTLSYTTTVSGPTTSVTVTSVPPATTFTETLTSTVTQPTSITLASTQISTIVSSYTTTELSTLTTTSTEFATSLANNVQTSTLSSTETITVTSSVTSTELSTVSSTLTTTLQTATSTTTYFTTITTALRASSASVTCSPSPVIAGSTTVVACTATVEGSSPTGTVSWVQSGLGSVVFTGSNTTCTLSMGSCTVTMTAAKPGTVRITAEYSGDAFNLDSKGAANLNLITSVNSPTAKPSIVTVTCSKTSPVVGTSTRCKATVAGDSSGSPSGTVSWSASAPGKFSVSSCRLRKGYCSASFTPTSANQLVNVTAFFLGDKGNLPSYGNFSLTVPLKATNTLISCAPTSDVAGSPTVITCHAKAIGYDPSGTVTWAWSGSGNITLAQVETCTLVKGSCYVTFTGTLAGTVYIQATYSGDANNLGSSGSHEFIVQT